MTSCVIVQDHANYPERVRALKGAHPRVHSVAPWDKPNRHSTTFRPPDEWLPEGGEFSLAKKCWWKADAMGFAAARALQIEADYYWFIESDVVASQQRWKAVFADWENDPTDLVAPAPRTRQQSPWLKVWQLPSTPPWADNFILMAVFRISRRGLEECVRHAVETREVFSEVSLPSVVHRAGFTIAGLNQRQTHSNNQTFGPCAPCVVRNPKLLNHPVKENSFEP